MDTIKPYKKQRDQIISETIAALLVSGGNKTETADKLGINRSTLYDRLVLYPEIEKTVAEVPKQALTVLRAGSLEAAMTLVDGLSDKREKYNNAKDILDRVGLTGDKGNTVNVENKILVIPSELMTKYGIASNTENRSTG